MPGGGTKLGITPNKPQAICLDVTRLVRRTGRVMTGVDRVEWAYLDWCLSMDLPIFGLMRSAFGYLILDRSGLELIQAKTQNAEWSSPDTLSRFSYRLSEARKGAEATLRKAAINRAPTFGLARALKKSIREPYLYFNTGHSNLTVRVLGAVRQSGGRAFVLIHDMIPLTHPEFQRPGTKPAFEKKMRAVSTYADTLICNSQETLTQTSRVLTEFGRMPPAFVAHLGVVPAQPGLQGPEIPKPYVICVGTIEPRKNHALLLDLWESWSREGGSPHLVICGTRGWKNDEVFAKLDALKSQGCPITELNSLDDETMLRLVKDASAALFPSFVEGYGLPQIEAANLGVPLICGDLDIYREILGDLPVYVDVNDPYSWRRAVETIVQTSTEGRLRADEHEPKFQAPTWDSHFETVLTHVG